MKSIPNAVASVAAWRWRWLLMMVLMLMMFSSSVLGVPSDGGPSWGMHRHKHFGRPVGTVAPPPPPPPHLQKTVIPALQNYPQTKHKHHPQTTIATGLPRGGYGRMGSEKNNVGYDSDFGFRSATPSSSFVRILGTVTQLLISMGKIVLPPLVGTVKGVVLFYRALPMDAIRAQIGLVYCFLGGYYPTLFSSLQAAKYCGWSIMVQAVSDLTEEAIKVVDEIEEEGAWDNDSDSDNRSHKKDLFLRQTHIVLKTVDPIKINTAAGALYTTWLGISTILQREYARVINLSLTLAEGIETVGCIVLVPVLNLVTPRDYRRWVPVLLGWTAKAAAMRVAWRIERVLTAATSAIAGGAMVARSLTNMLSKYNHKRKQQQQQQHNGGTMAVLGNQHKWNAPDSDGEDDCDDEDGGEDAKLSLGEQVVGCAVGGLGFYTQIESQYKQKFSFVVPFPLNLVTWPFDLAERWIQWYITEHS